ncbi:hypothetical protein ABZ631_19925, partial [Nocardiopsis alba]|uniref:hypothetical protein n=1 Tax=Nocardiopsis alba TaxID=53437 RepID=UPI0033F24A5F
MPCTVEAYSSSREIERDPRAPKAPWGLFLFDPISPEYSEDVILQLQDVANAEVTIAEGATWEHVDLNL